MNWKRRIDRVLVTVSFALLSLVAAMPGEAQSAPARLSEVTVTSQPDAVTIYVKTSREPKYTTEVLDAPARLVLDLEDTVYAWRKSPLPVDREPLKQIRGAQFRQGVARVVFDLTRTSGYAIREESDGLAVIIPTAAPETPAAPAPAPATPAPTSPPPSDKPEPKAAAAPAVEPPTAPVVVAQAPPAPAPPTSSARRLISFDFKDADVVNLLRILAAESGRNIVIGDDVKGKMSISLRNVPWELALDTVLETRGLRKLEKDGVMRIVSNEQLIKERETNLRVEEARLKAENEIKAKKAEAELKEQEALDKKRAAEQALAELRARGPLREETIRLSYADPEEIARTLQGILGIPPEGVQAQIAPPMYPAGFGPPNPELRPVPALITSTPPPPPPGFMGSPSAEVLAKGITIRAHKPTNSIFIRHYEADLERIKKLIRESLDVPLPQVKIEARMEILDRADLFAIGVKWGGGAVLAATDRATIVGRGLTANQIPSGIPTRNLTSAPSNPNATLSNVLPVSASTLLESGGNIVQLPIGGLLGGAATSGLGGIAFGLVGSKLSLNLALEALKQQGKTRTLARPEVVTVENAKASISLGEEIPYATVSSAGTQIQFKEALLKLDVTPTVVREKDVTKIKLKVLVENNARGTTTIDLGSSGAPPVIRKRKAETEVLVKEGDRLVIAGVTNNVDEEEERKVPLFGDIPVLGWLFKQRGTRFAGQELVVFITPSVLVAEPKTQASAK